MKIISNNECYIQREDLDYLMDNNRDIPNELFKAFENNNDDFVKIENKIAFEYVLNSDIVSFNDLENLSLKKLNRELFKLKSLFDDFDSRDVTEEEVKQALLEEKNRRYIIKQLLEIIKYKRGQSELSYPDVPKPNTLGVTNGRTNASLSLNFGNVVIYNMDGSRVDEEENKEFCEVAYRMLMHDYIQDENIDINYFCSNNKIILKRKIKELVKKKK